MLALPGGPFSSQPPAELLSLRKGFEHGYGCYDLLMVVQGPVLNTAT